MSPAVTRVLEALAGGIVRRTDSGGQARCPSHEDDRASLTIGTGADGRALVHCHAGCRTADVLSALRLTTADLMPSRDEPRPYAKGSPQGTGAGRGSGSGVRGRIIATYDYRDERRELLYQVVRFEPKDFRQRRPNGDGWTWSLGDVRRVLYRLPELLATKADVTVFIVEGEKDAEALARLGLVATTNAGGAGKWRAEYSGALRSRHVVILPDNDEPGQKHAAEVAAAVVGTVASVKIVELPGLPNKGDVSDWLAKGGTVAALFAMVEKARLCGQHEREPGQDDDDKPAIVLEDLGELDYTDGAESVEHPVANGGGQVVALPSTAWPEAEPLPDGLASVPSFDDRLLPEALRPWLSDVAERTQCPPEYGAVGALVALGAIIGRRCAIRPKRQDDWTVVPNLWGAVVGPPSSMKSPALAEALRPLRRLAVEATEKHQRRLEDHAATLAEAKARRTVIDGQMKKAAKSGLDMTALRAEYTAAADPPEPLERRYIVNDATVEKLGELLNENPRGLLHFRDELAGWMATLDRDGHENDRAFFLEAWNGAGRYTYDRIGRGTLHIEAACVSMLGGIQPGPLGQYLRSAVRGGAGDDGLMQRFQALVYPDPPRTWRNVDRWPDNEARNRAFEVFRRLDMLTPETLGAAIEEDGLPFLRFDSEAQGLCDGWREALMNRLRSGDEHAAIEAHLAKYPRLLPSLALICHLADAATMPAVPVSVAAASRAVALCDFFEAHARRLYQTVTADELNAARTLLRKLRVGKLGPTFSARDVYRAQWAGLADREVVEKALTLLAEHGWLRRTEVETGGRGRVEYEAHPCLRAKEAA